MSSTSPCQSAEYPMALAARVASRFELASPLESHDFPDKGNINLDTYLLVAGRGEGSEYLLQRINQEVFTRPRYVMEAMIACLDAQRSKVDAGAVPDGGEWEVVTLVPTRSGARFLELDDRRGRTHWRVMVKIPDCRTYKSLGEIPDRAEQLRVAEEAGRGLALYGDLTSEMDVSNLVSPLPGYRDTRVYYDQFHAVLEGTRTLDDAASRLPADDVVRASTQEHFLVHAPEEEHRARVEDRDLRAFIELARAEEDFGMTLSRAMESGAIRTVGIHGDTKLENFLFSAGSGQVKSLVDLDTIMPHTWLSDWGDMVRSLTNVAGEKEPDMERVRVDMEIYEAVARGFISTAREVTSAEVALMVDAVEVIALELGLRFMTDYLRGDNYFKLGPADPPDLNRTRGMVQLTLFERLRERSGEARALVEALLAARDS